MSLGRCRGIPEQTVERRGSLVFCLCKSSEAERERLKPLERNERVCEGWSDTHDDSDDKFGIRSIPDCRLQKTKLVRPCNVSGL